MSYGERFIFSECQEKIKLWWIILAIILAILLIGIILLLIWKCCATLIDRREFAKFEKERQNAKWDTVSTIIQFKVKWA